MSGQGSQRARRHTGRTEPRLDGTRARSGGATQSSDAGRPGLVIATHGRHCVVEADDGSRRLCHPRGKKSDVVVGDRVRWEPTPGGGDEGVIETVEPRRNLMWRQDEWRSKSFAANLDQLLMWIAVEPVFSEAQLTRALIAAHAGGIAATIVLNKTDLPGADAARDRLQPYRAMGYPLVEVSLKHERDTAMARLAALLRGRATLVLGPSGAGKSTLVNAFVPDAQAEVGAISQALNSGRHTTTATRWYWLDAPSPAVTDTDTDADAEATANATADATEDGPAEATADVTTDAAPRGALIDSPGFQEFGLHHLAAEELATHMPDLARYLGDCRFHNCTHRQEPGCAVQAAVERGDVSPTRLSLYTDLFDELSRPRW